VLFSLKDYESVAWILVDNCLEVKYFNGNNEESSGSVACGM
jgi:hypothetical protein